MIFLSEESSYGGTKRRREKVREKGDAKKIGREENHPAQDDCAEVRAKIPAQGGEERVGTKGRNAEEIGDTTWSLARKVCFETPTDEAQICRQASSGEKEDDEARGPSPFDARRNKIERRRRRISPSTTTTTAEPGDGVNDGIGARAEASRARNYSVARALPAPGCSSGAGLAFTHPPAGRAA